MRVNHPGVVLHRGQISASKRGAGVRAELGSGITVARSLAIGQPAALGLDRRPRPL